MQRSPWLRSGPLNTLGTKLSCIEKWVCNILGNPRVTLTVLHKEVITRAYQILCIAWLVNPHSTRVVTCYQKIEMRLLPAHCQKTHCVYYTVYSILKLKLSFILYHTKHIVVHNLGSRIFYVVHFGNSIWYTKVNCANQPT